MTLPQHLPVVRFWRTHPEAAHRTPESSVERQIAITRTLEPALEAALAKPRGHRDPGDPGRGLRLLPRPATLYGPVRTVFLHEDEENQVPANYSHREPEAGPQRHRARISVLSGWWFAAQAPPTGCKPLRMADGCSRPRRGAWS